jgi:hypothetical protein
MSMLWIEEDGRPRSAEYWAGESDAAAAVDRLDCRDHGGLMIQERELSEPYLSVAGCGETGYLVWFGNGPIGLAAIGDAEARGVVDVLVGNQFADHPIRQLVGRETVDRAVHWFFHHLQPAPDVPWQDEVESRHAALDQRPDQ